MPIRRGFGDIVTMPLPTEWGPTVLPSAAVPPVAAAQAAAQAAAGLPPGTPTPIVAPDGNLYAAFPPSPAYPAGVAYPAAYGGDGTFYLTGGQPIPVQVPLPSVGPISAQCDAAGPTLGAASHPSGFGTSSGASTGKPLNSAVLLSGERLGPDVEPGRASLGLDSKSRGTQELLQDRGIGRADLRFTTLDLMPSQGEKLEEMFSQPLTAFQDGVGNFTGLDVVLGQFVVPIGYDGALNRVVFQFNGDGFQDFSGSIVWRVLVNSRYARNLGNVKNTFGDFATAFSVPGSDNIRLVSQQTITLLANIPAGSPVSGGTVMAGAFGWVYPRR